jgi:hypothetical protein
MSSAITGFMGTVEFTLLSKNKASKSGHCIEAAPTQYCSHSPHLPFIPVLGINLRAAWDNVE